MWKKARELFAGKNALARARGSGTLPEVFVSMDITFLCLPEAFREGLPATATQEEALAFIEKAAVDLAARGSFEPFVYAGPNGSKVFPVFTDASHAETFARSYASEIGRILPFQVLSAAGSSLASGIQAGAVVVVNPRTSEEMLLSKEEVRHIRERGLTAG